MEGCDSNVLKSTGRESSRLELALAELDAATSRLSSAVNRTIEKHARVQLGDESPSDVSPSPVASPLVAEIIEHATFVNAQADRLHAFIERSEV